MNAITHQKILAAGRYRDVSLEGVDRETARRLYRFMLRLRRCEEALAAEYHPADEMRCPVHFCIGQETVPAALSVLLKAEDHLYCHHRSHGYYLAKGAPMRAMFAELYGKETGANGGRAGSQDISFPAVNFHSGAILAGATAVAMGTALALKTQQRPGVVVAGFGESATDEGIFWETVSYAALRKLPIVFVCENNNYSVFSPLLKRQPTDNISEKVSAFGMKSAALFGNDAPLVYRILREAIEAARAGSGPAFVEAYTCRWSGHYGPASDDLVGYRSEEEVRAWKENDPIALLEEAMAAAGQADAAGRTALLKEIDAEVADCFHFAKSSAFPKGGDWRAMNYAAASPEADRLLVEIDEAAFDHEQVAVQAKGY